MYKEIKKNGSARSLRAALLKFSEVSRLIRPQKGRAYVTNLLPCLVKVVRRQEEFVHEALAQAVPKILSALGAFTSDSESRLLLKTCMGNLFDSNPVIRRTTAVCLVAVCSHSRKPAVFFPWLLSVLMDFLVPVNIGGGGGGADEETPVNRILGILTCSRLLVPKLAEVEEESSGPNEVNLLERLLQLYELCLHFSGHKDHNVVSHSLETLQQLLRTPPTPLKDCLTSSTGLSRSFIFENQGRQKKQSDSSLSRMGSLMINEEEESLLDLEPSVSESAPLGGTVQMMDAAAHGDGDTRQANSPVADAVGDGDAESLEMEGLPQTTQGEESPEPQDLAEDDSVFSNDAEERFEEAEEEEDNNIGGFCDADVPLIYCARKLTLSFLLTRQKGQLPSNAKSRVSIKVLAFGCLTAIVRLSPKVFLLTLLQCEEEEVVDEEKLATSLIRDVSGYSGHDDPQLRGCAAILLGTVLRGALVESGGDLEPWFNERRPDQGDIRDILTKMCSDSSAVALKTVVSALGLFLEPLMMSPKFSLAVSLLESVWKAASKSGNYWLVKVELCRLIAGIPFTPLHLVTGNTDLQVKFLGIILAMVGDEDGRVRLEASNCLATMVANLYEPGDEGNSDPVSVAAIGMSERLLHPIMGHHPIQQTFASRNYVQFLAKSGYRIGRASCRKVFRLVTELHNTLLTSQSSSVTLGTIEALTELSDHFSPVRHPSCWGCHKQRTRRASAANVDKVLTSPAFNLLGLLTALLTKSSLAVDLTAHANILKLSSRLLASLSISHIGKGGKESSRTPASSDASAPSYKVSSNKNLEHLATALLYHSVRLLAIVTAVVEDIQPAVVQPAATKTPLPSIANPSLSPLKKRLPGEAEQAAKEAEKAAGGKKDASQETQRKMGTFSHSPHYMKIYDILKSTHLAYKANMDSKTTKKFEVVLRECLLTLGCILDVSESNCLGKYVEEVLGYMKTTLAVDPLASLRCVQLLLQCIFRMNFAGDPSLADSLDGQRAEGGDASSPGSSGHHQRGVFHPCFDLPRNELVHTFHLARDASSSMLEGGAGEHLGFTSSVAPSSSRLQQQRPPVFKNLGRSADRAVLSANVRLFEGIVIRALRHYTLTTDTEQQGQVLQLLVQLVQLRVNYCLLDSDQIFIGYVVKQMELIEEGQVTGAGKLVPEIFRFLVLLSYEKYHSKPIIDVAKILRLAEGLFASGQPPEEFALPALLPLAEDLFCYRGSMASSASATDEAAEELETQRKAVLGMLLKLAVYPEALQCLFMVLSALKAEDEEGWRKVSRTVMDVLLPLLANQKLRLDDKRCLDLVLQVFAALSPGCLRPVDPFLSAVLTCAVDLSDLREMQRWLGFVVVAFPIITNQSPEEGILSRLEELGIQVGSANLPSPSTASGHLLDTSMESSTSTTSDPLGVGPAVKPEVTLARFLVQVVGASCGKLHELVFSQDGGDRSFLQQELSHLLLFFAYMLQSGRYPRVARAAQTLAKQGKKEGPEVMYTVEGISELFLQVSHACPYLTLQWLHILILLGWCPQEFWCRVLAPGKKEEEGANEAIKDNEQLGLNDEILKR